MYSMYRKVEVIYYSVLNRIRLIVIYLVHLALLG